MSVTFYWTSPRAAMAASQEALVTPLTGMMVTRNSSPMWCTADYRRLLQAQRLLDNKLREETCGPMAAAAVARAIIAIIEEKRILRMRPKPRDLDTTLLERKARSIMVPLIEAPKESLSRQTTPHGTTPEGANRGAT